MLLALLFISKAFLAGQVPGALIGFVAGAFAPSLGRKVKALFVKEASAVKADVASGVAKAAAAVEKKA